MNLTDSQRAAITAYLDTHHLPSGLGTREKPCSVAAINLALTGELTDRIPDCMSAVIGHWVIVVQDAMPDTLRNSAAWKDLLPFAAGTGRKHEAERLALILDWMWGTVLPVGQSLADQHGYGDAWRRMCTERTVEAARAVSSAICAATRAATDVATRATATNAAATAAAYAIDTAICAAYAAYAADAAAYAACAAHAACAACAAHADTSDRVWRHFDPCALLASLIAVGP